LILEPRKWYCWLTESTTEFDEKIALRGKEYRVSLIAD